MTTIHLNPTNFFFVWVFVVSISAVQAQTPFHWPKGKKAAIVLTYDDALTSQLTIAIPQLNKAKLKGTFFLMGNMTPSQFEQWRAASNKGHELGNHSLYHPCASTSFKMPPQYFAENYSLFTMLREIAAMNLVLYGIDNKQKRTYAYPCTQTLAGTRDYKDTLKLSGLISYARGGGDKHAIVTDFQHVDPYLVPSWGFSDSPSGEQLISFVKDVEASGGMGVVMFHGVGGDYLSVSAEAHQQLVTYLKQHRKELWVMPFKDVMDYMMATRDGGGKQK
jgi:peptidoglycan/xylan/chitin deacetylase (PgdA/CDA1 family)